MKSILITGSSGFIGRKLCTYFLNLGHNVLGIDIKPSDISHNKYSHAILDLSVQDDKLLNILSYHKVCITFHLAAKIKVDKSMSNPEKYYKNNIIALINLLEVLKKLEIHDFVFASTGSVYGKELKNVTEGYTEEEAGDVASVYSQTKLMGEFILKSYEVYGFRGYIFRFFNVAGVYPVGKSPCHLIDILVRNIKQGKDIFIYGDDYNTRDGTCIRDYIHIDDICEGFNKAVKRGFADPNFITLNLGTSNGYTVKEVVEETMIIVGTVKVVYKPRRPGDSAVLISNNDRSKYILEWKPQMLLTDIIKDTLASYQ